MNITPNQAEKTAKALTDATLAQAVAAIRTDGYVLIEDAIPRQPLEILRQRMDKDSAALLAANPKRRHLQQGPPPFAPFIFAEIVANPFAVQVSKAVLGEGFFNAFYNGNTNAPGSDTQNLHRDSYLLWPQRSDYPATTLVVNISPQDVGPDNGGTELWPATHLIGDDLTEERIEAQRVLCPPVQVESKVGSLLIRDIRLWHRGVPNTSDQFRHMIALVHQICWFHRAQTLVYQKGCEAAFDHPDLDPNAVFVDEEPDYLFAPQTPFLAGRLLAAKRPCPKNRFILGMPQSRQTESHIFPTQSYYGALL